MKTSAKDYWKLFKPSACNLKLQGTTKTEVFGELIDTMVKAKVLPAAMKEAALEALETREGVGSTGVGQNLAIPHVKLDGLDSVVASLSVHPTGLDWAALDGEPVHIFFTILRPSQASDTYDPERHIEMMRWIASVGRISDFRNFAMAVGKKTELVDLLKEMAERQP